MPRQMLTNEHWSRLKPIMLEMGIYNKHNLRKTTEGIFYRLRVGCPWRDLPKEFGHWNTVYKRFKEWSESNKLYNIFKAVIINPDLEWAFIDGSIVKAHQHSIGAIKGKERGIGKGVIGNSSKIHMVVDSYGLPIEFTLTGGQVHDSQEALCLIHMFPEVTYWIGDRGYDSEEIREKIKAQNSTDVIPKKKNSLTGNHHMDWYLYRHRHLVENVFAKLKNFRAIATRYDKLKQHFFSSIALVCTFLWLLM